MHRRPTRAIDHFNAMAFGNCLDSS